MAAPRPPPITPPPAPGKKFRAAIEQARLDGIDPETLVLRLTLGDLARLKRDRDIANDEISFGGGEMRYLGVRVVGGDIETSTLVVVPS